MRRAALWTVVWAGPLSFFASLALLVSNQALFRHGPDAPEVGFPEAWGLMWLCLALVVAGHLLSASIGLGWLVRTIRRRELIGRTLRLQIAYHMGLALPVLLWLFLG